MPTMRWSSAGFASGIGFDTDRRVLRMARRPMRGENIYVGNSTRISFSENLQNGSIVVALEWRQSGITLAVHHEVSPASIRVEHRGVDIPMQSMFARLEREIRAVQAERERQARREASRGERQPRWDPVVVTAEALNELRMPAYRNEQQTLPPPSRPPVEMDSAESALRAAARRLAQTTILPYAQALAAVRQLASVGFSPREAAESLQATKALGSPAVEEPVVRSVRTSTRMITLPEDD